MASSTRATGRCGWRLQLRAAVAPGTSMPRGEGTTAPTTRRWPRVVDKGNGIARRHGDGGKYRCAVFDALVTPWPSTFEQLQARENRIGPGATCGNVTWA